MSSQIFGYTLSAVIGLLVGLKYLFKKVTIYDFERGLKYRNGKLKGELGPGVYYISRKNSKIDTVDVRPFEVLLCSQEILSSDGVPIRVSIIANLKVIDFTKAYHETRFLRDRIYTELQLVLRESVSEFKIDEMLECRKAIDAKILEIIGDKLLNLGIELIFIKTKDITLPGKLKEIFAKVTASKKEGLAALERAKGETAALRSLANAAKMLEKNPNLYNLRLIQAVEKGGLSNLSLTDKK